MKLKIFSLLILLLAFADNKIEAQTSPAASTTPATSTAPAAPTPPTIRLPGQWPKINTPPQPKAEWVALVDLSKAPKAKIRKIGSPCPAKGQDFCNWACYFCNKDDTDIRICPTKNDWALTYDDGPTNSTTIVLDDLEKKNLKATFFVIGSNVIQNPQILQEIAKAGHQIGVHTWSHSPLTTQTNEEIIAEIKWTELAIKEATGVTPKFMRPPTGDCDDRVRFIMKSLGYKIAFWDFDSSDWLSNQDPTFNLNWIDGNFTMWTTNDNSTTGHMSLQHDAFPQTAAKAPGAADIVMNAGYNIRQVANCHNMQPYLENIKLPESSPTKLPKSEGSTNNGDNSTMTAAGSSSTMAPSGSSTVNVLSFGLVSLIVFTSSFVLNI